MSMPAYNFVVERVINKGVSVLKHASLSFNHCKMTIKTKVK